MRAQTQSPAKSSNGQTFFVFKKKIEPARTEYVEITLQEIFREAGARLPQATMARGSLASK